MFTNASIILYERAELQIQQVTQHFIASRMEGGYHRQTEKGLSSKKCTRLLRIVAGFSCFRIASAPSHNGLLIY